MEISKEILRQLYDLDIDRISTRAFCPYDIFLHKKNLVGIFIIGEGLVLKPVYLEIVRFGNLLKVATATSENMVFGGYSVFERRFVITPKYTELGFWQKFDEYRSQVQKNRYS